MGNARPHPVKLHSIPLFDPLNAKKLLVFSSLVPELKGFYCGMFLDHSVVKHLNIL